MNDSAGSQFFVMTSASPHLDGSYAAFGKVTQGAEVADAIVAQPTDRGPACNAPEDSEHPGGDRAGVSFRQAVIRRGWGLATPLRRRAAMLCAFCHPAFSPGLKESAECL